MKVLISWHGAVEPAYRFFFTELEKLGVEILLICPEQWTEGGRLQTFADKGGDSLRTIVLKTCFKDHVRAFFYPNILKITSAIRRFNPDVMHIMEEPFSFTAFQFLILKKMVGLRTKTMLFSFENIDIKQKLPYSFFQSYNLSNVDSIVVVPQESEALWRKRGFNGNITRIPLGIEPALFETTVSDGLFFKKTNSSGATLKIGYAGRIVKEKGLDTLIEAVCAESVSRYEVYLAGSGNYSAELISLARVKGIEKKIHFLGPLNQRQLPAFYRDMDVLVLPSRTTSVWKEQFGRVLIEAMGCGTPVIGSSSGEIPNVIGDSGLVFKEGDADELARCLEKILDINVRKRFSELGKQKALKEYTWQAVARQYIGLYENLMRTR